jgi:hypothetical protein
LQGHLSSLFATVQRYLDTASFRKLKSRYAVAAGIQRNTDVFLWLLLHSYALSFHLSSSFPSIFLSSMSFVFISCIIILCFRLFCSQMLP